jgi:hypothetical protein
MSTSAQIETTATLFNGSQMRTSFDMYNQECRPPSETGYHVPLLDPLTFWALAGQEEGLDELAFTAYRHA